MGMLVFISKAPERSLRYESRSKSPGLLTFLGLVAGLNDRMCCFAACRAKRHFVLVGLAYVAFAYSHRVVVGSVDGTVVGCWSAVFMAAGGLFFLVG